MVPPDSEGRVPAVTVAIPSYNSARWLPSTLAALAHAIVASGARAEVIVIDDGSTDDTRDVVTAAAASFPGELRVVTQDNSGRFLARWEGIRLAAADLILLLDSRVLIHPDSLGHVLDSIKEDPALVAWNAAVVTDADAPLVGLFWEVPTHVFWGRYLRAPRVLDLTAENFDQAPKGTTMFLARKDVLVDAFQNAWPVGDTKLVSDDTKVLRRIATTRSIRLDPAFSATYRPRTTVRGFIAHTYDRGTLFVDSYAGTSPARSTILIALAIAPVLLVATISVLFGAGLAGVVWWICLTMLFIVLLPAAIAAVNRCRARSILAYVCCLPLFVIPFWLGLVRGVLIHRKSFARIRRSNKAAAPRTERQ